VSFQWIYRDEITSATAARDDRLRECRDINLNDGSTIRVREKLTRQRSGSSDSNSVGTTRNKTRKLDGFAKLKNVHFGKRARGAERAASVSLVIVPGEIAGRFLSLN
jgi:hypothetical protein